MPDYCIYLVGPRRQIVTAPRMEQLRDDSDALMRASGMVSDIAGAEVWLGQRLVCHLPAKSSPSGKPAPVQ